MFTRPRKSPAQLAAEAFEWLNITPAQVEAEVRVSHWFPRLGGLDAVLGYLRAADGPEANKTLELWDATSTTYRRGLPFEARGHNTRQRGGRLARTGSHSGRMAGAKDARAANRLRARREMGEFLLPLNVPIRRAPDLCSCR